MSARNWRIAWCGKSTHLVSVMLWVERQFSFTIFSLIYPTWYIMLYTSRTVGWTCSRGPHTAGAVTLSCLVGSFTNYCFGLYTPMHRCVFCFALVDAGALGKPENDLDKNVALAPWPWQPRPDPVTLNPAVGGAGGWALEASVRGEEARHRLHPRAMTTPACSCSWEIMSVQIASHVLH